MTNKSFLYKQLKSTLKWIGFNGRSLRNVMKGDMSVICDLWIENTLKSLFKMYDRVFMKRKQIAYYINYVR